VQREPPAGAGCFPGNVIPANRLDPNALALLNMMPLPNVAATSPGSGALSNFTRQETPENPRMNICCASTAGRRANNSYCCRTASSAPTSSDPKSPRAGQVGLLQTALRLGRQRAQRRLEPHLEGASERIRHRRPRATEGFGVKDDSDYAKFTRSNVASPRRSSTRS